MSRNFKPDYLKKLQAIQTANGYKIDLANYVYNPAITFDYPGLRKLTAETNDTLEYTRFYYFKHYDGTGEYYKEVYTVPKNGDTWNISKTSTEELIEVSRRFSLNDLIKHAEAIG